MTNISEYDNVENANNCDNNIMIIIIIMIMMMTIIIISYLSLSLLHSDNHNS